MVAGLLIGKPLLWSEDPLDRDLVIWYRFDRVTGERLPDWSGRHYHVDTPALDRWEANRYGVAWYVDNNTAHAINLNSLNAVIPRVSERGTVEITFIPESWGTDRYLFSGRNAGGAAWNTRNYQWYQNAVAQWNIGLGDSGAINTGLSVTLNELNHSIHTWDAGSYTTFVNGEAGNTGSYNYDNADYTAIRLGCVYADAVPFDGEILEFRCYNRILTLDEARQRYQIATARVSGITPLWMNPFWGEVAARIPRPPAAYNTLAIY